MTLPDAFICNVPLRATAPLLTMDDPVDNVPLTRSSVALDVLLIVKDADEVMINDLAVAISTWPEPVGAMVTAIWLGLANPVLSMVCMEFPFISNPLLPEPALVTEPLVWLKLPFTLSVLLPDAPLLQKSSSPPDTVTFPFTVMSGEPVPAVKTKTLVPEIDKLFVMLKEDEVEVPS